MKNLDRQDLEFLETECEQILASETFVRSPMLSKLLRYLLMCTQKSEPPKEIAIAIEVFDKNDDFDPAEDAFVRVYMHKLRSRIEQYYAKVSPLSDKQIAIPKGGYQLVPVIVDDNIGAETAPDKHYLQTWFVPLLIGIFIGALTMYLGSFSMSGKPEKAEATPKLAGYWKEFKDNGRPTYILLGDVFLHEYELDPQQGKVLVRNYDLNSERDLAQWLDAHPQYNEKVSKSANRFIMQSSAYTLTKINDMATLNNDSFFISTLSDADPKMIRDANFIYVGMIKSMGFLQAYFEASHFACEKACKHTLISDEGRIFASQGNESGSHIDYAVVASHTRDNGAISLFLSGFSDTGIMQAVRTLTDETELQKTLSSASQVFGQTIDDDFSIVFEAKGYDYADIDASVIMVNGHELQ